MTNDNESLPLKVRLARAIAKEHGEDSCDVIGSVMMPNWGEADRGRRDWRNYLPYEIGELWDDLTPCAKLVAYAFARSLTDEPDNNRTEWSLWRRVIDMEGDCEVVIHRDGKRPMVCRPG